MSEYISREEAEKRLFQRAEIANSAYIDQTPCQIMMLAQNVVHLIPAADVLPVVLCRECKYSHPLMNNCKKCSYWSAHGVMVADHDFCSHGERREES